MPLFEASRPLGLTYLTIAEEESVTVAEDQVILFPISLVLDGDMILDGEILEV